MGGDGLKRDPGFALKAWFLLVRVCHAGRIPREYALNRIPHLGSIRVTLTYTISENAGKAILKCAIPILAHPAPFVIHAVGDRTLETARAMDLTSNAKSCGTRFGCSIE